MKQLFLTLALLAMLSMPAAADRDMADSYVNLITPITADPGDIVIFEFDVWNDSPDGECTARVHFVFPETFHVLNGWFDDGGAGWNFDFIVSGDYDNYCDFTDNDGDFGEIQGGTGGVFYVEVDVIANTECGEYNIRGKQYGDEVGAPPHWIFTENPFFVCTIPAETGTWSSVKSLY